MPNVKSVIAIADEFSEPLLRLSARALESGSAVETLNEAVNIGKEYVSGYVDELKDSARAISDTFSNKLIPEVKDLVGSIGSAGDAIVDVFGAQDIANSLKDMTMLAFDGSSAFDALFDAVLDQKELVGEFVNQVSENVVGIVSDIKESLVPSVIQAKESFVGLGSAAKAMFKDFNKDTILDFSAALVEAGFAAKDVGANVGYIGLQIMKTISFIRNFKLRLINSISMGAFNGLKKAYINTFKNVSSAIERSLDDISMTDKLNAMYGDAGAVAKDRAYKLANELGESARMVTSLSAKAAYEGIGTDHFERMMRLADKVGKLGPGESTESVANSLIDNIKNGQDASSLARMFGGGQMMERQLRSSGYERALHRGDLDEALRIAEEIAEQAGFTDENYEKATDSLSNNYKRIQNLSDNMKQRFSEIYATSFGPAVKKVREFLESEKFKKIQSIVEVIIKKVGEFVSSTVEMMIDNIHWLGIFLGIGIATKTMLIFKLVKKILFFATPFKGILTFAFKYLTGIVGKVVTLIAKQGALAAIKLAAPWALAAAAVGGIIFGVYKLSGSTKSFTEWLKDKFKTFSHIMASGYKFLQNVFTNVFIFFERVGSYILELPALASAAFQDILDELEELKKKIKGEEISYHVYVDAEEYKKMTEEEREALGIKYTHTDKLTQDEVSDWIRGTGDARKKWTDINKADGEWWGHRMYYVTDKRQSNVDGLLEKIQANQTQYIDVWEGTDKALEEGWSATSDWLKKIFNQGEEQAKTEAGIKTDTGKIRQFNEQEEELRWLKAFSDRQIMSAYGNMTTTNNRTINMNGVSQNVMAEAYRRNRSTIPPRAALGM